MKTAEVDVEKVSPTSVTEFLQTSQLKATLPKLLQNTILQNRDRFVTLLSYCLKVEDLSLKGLPLLLTQDQILRVFERPVFSTDFFDLLPKRPDVFLNYNIKYKFSDTKDMVVEFQLANLIDYETDFSDEMKDPIWIKRFWSFVQIQLTKEEMSASTLALEIPHWKVLPVKRNAVEKDFLPLQDGKSAIRFLLQGTKQENIAKVLKTLGCWELDSGFFELNFNLVETLGQFCSDLHDHNGLVKILTFLSGFSEKLGRHDHLTILAYFEDEANKLTPESISSLKSLPLFESIDGQKVKLTHASARILKARLPEEGMKDWISTVAVTFLKDQPKLSNLYKRLGLEEISELEVYSSYILSRLERMNDHDLKTHLINLYQKLDADLNERKLQREPESRLYLYIIKCLKTLSLIGPVEQRKSARQLYDPRNEFFKKLLPDYQLLPKEYRYQSNKDLYQMCKLMGMQCEVTEELIMQVATSLERNRSDAKSEFLVNHLEENSEKLSEHFLMQLSSIKFIPPHQVSQGLKVLHGPLNGTELMCFRDSVLSSNEHLVWTSSNLLPYWASVGGSLGTSLGVHTEPPFEKVLEHCQKLCTDLARRKAPETTGNENSIEFCQLLTKVMIDIYSFLKTQTIESSFNDTPCVLVENGKRLVFPRQISINMQEDDLKPHLYKLPLELGAFHELFCAMGATKNPSVEQFAQVLKTIYNASKGRKLDPEEKRLSETAIKHFFATLKTNASLLDAVDQLYLFTKDGLLRLSSKIRFNDRPMFSDRIQNSDCEDANFYGLDLAQLQGLPVRLRPMFLSDVIVEKLDPDLGEGCDPYDPDCKLKQHFDNFLSDPDFHQGLTRLAKHCCAKSGVKFDPKVMKEKIKELSSIELECRPELRTILESGHNGELVVGSNKEQDHFLDDNGSIMLNHKLSMEDRYELAEVLTSMVTKILDNYVDNHCPIVQALLNLRSPTEIERRLDKRDISKDDANGFGRFEYIVGELIEDCFESFLTTNPAHYFKIGELVGYLRDDDSYILVKILKELPCAVVDVGFNFGRKYLVNNFCLYQ